MQTVATAPTDSPYANDSRYSKLSLLTCVVLVWFHIHAVAALWSFTWTNLLVATFALWVAGGLGISIGYHRLHAPRLQDLQMV
jgi:stearoyl-CoA desaturase (delta-9 desaturase)